MDDLGVFPPIIFWRNTHVSLLVYPWFYSVSSEGRPFEPATWRLVEPVNTPSVAWSWHGHSSKTCPWKTLLVTRGGYHEFAKGNNDYSQRLTRERYHWCWFLNIKWDIFMFWSNTYVSFVLVSWWSSCGNYRNHNHVLFPLAVNFADLQTRHVKNEYRCFEDDTTYNSLSNMHWETISNDKIQQQRLLPPRLRLRLWSSHFCEGFFCEHCCEPMRIEKHIGCVVAKCILPNILYRFSKHTPFLLACFWRGHILKHGFSIMGTQTTAQLTTVHRKPS